MRGESGRGPALSISLWVSWDFWSLLAPECSAGAMVLFSCGRAVMGCDLDPNRRAMGNRIVYSPSAQTKRDALRRETYCGRMTRLVGLGEWGVEIVRKALRPVSLLHYDSGRRELRAV